MVVGLGSAPSIEHPDSVGDMPNVTRLSLAEDFLSVRNAKETKGC